MIGHHNYTLDALAQKMYTTRSGNDPHSVV